jgi:uncharacterized membrane protein (UPF0127 family)
MSENTENTEKSDKPPFLTRGRMIVAGIVLATLAVGAISVTTNMKTMYGRWDDAGGKNAQLQLPSQRLERLDIVSGERRHGFMVEVMRTDGDRARGLMYRRYMPADNGMLFDFGQDQNITMWMKNTYISLDMIFLLADGRIHRIEQRTEPESEKVITSGVPVRAVLEVNSGVAIRLNLKPGDYIVHPMFK